MTSYTGTNPRLTGQALEVDRTGSVYLGGSYQNGNLVVGGQTLASPGLTAAVDGFVGRVWVVRASFDWLNRVATYKIGLLMPPQTPTYTPTHPHLHTTHGPHAHTIQQTSYANATPRPTPAPDSAGWAAMAAAERATLAPTTTPSRRPTDAPTRRPTDAPTRRPTAAPSVAPTRLPTVETARPTPAPTVAKVGERWMER